MALRRFWLDQDWPDQHELKQDQLLIQGELFHHIFEVCRFQADQEFELLSKGVAHLVRVVHLSKRQALVERVGQRPIAPPPRPHIHLALSAPRFPTADEIVEKCVELGVMHFRPFVSDFSYVRSTGQIPASRYERWQKIIRQATQQTGRGELMVLHEAVTLERALAEFNPTGRTLGLFSFEGPSQRSVRDELCLKRQHQWDDVWLFVGSEGGFSQSEVELFCRHEMEPLSFGSQVLRVETACLALLSVLKYELVE